jgi:drug/metabolite transporter (DMT)-like permease
MKTCNSIHLLRLILPGYIWGMEPEALSLPVRAPIPLHGLAMASLTVVCWASAFPAIRIAVREFGPLEVAFLRAVAASAVLGGIALARGTAWPAWRDMPFIALLGLLGHSLYTATLSQGQTRIPAAAASFLIASAPIWMVLIGRMTGAERITRWGLAGLLVSLLGVFLISLGRGGALKVNGYALIVLAAAVLQAVYSMGQRPLLARYSGLQVVTWCAVFSAIAFLPWSGRALAQFAHAGTGPRFCVLFLGVVPTGVGYWSWADANRHLPVSVAGSFLYLIPPVALFIGWAVLGEAPSLLSLSGGALVVGGVAMVQRLTRPRPGTGTRPRRTGAGRRRGRSAASGAGSGGRLRAGNHRPGSAGRNPTSCPWSPGPARSTGS